MRDLETAALARAVAALYSALTEQQASEVRRRLYFDAVKHEKPTEVEDRALEILEGGR